MAIRVNSQSQTDSLNKTGGSCGHLPLFPGFQLSSSSQRNSSGWINSITSINDRGETPLPLRAIHLENRSISPIAHFLMDGCLFRYSVYLSRVACRAARDFFSPLLLRMTSIECIDCRMRRTRYRGETKLLGPPSGIYIKIYLFQ